MWFFSFCSCVILWDLGRMCRAGILRRMNLLKIVHQSIPETMSSQDGVIASTLASAPARARFNPQTDPVSASPTAQNPSDPSETSPHLPHETPHERYLPCSVGNCWQLLDFASMCSVNDSVASRLNETHRRRWAANVAQALLTEARDPYILQLPALRNELLGATRNNKSHIESFLFLSLALSLALSLENCKRPHKNTNATDSNTVCNR